MMKTYLIWKEGWGPGGVLDGFEKNLPHVVSEISGAL